jgi:hypothetical protein
MVKMISLEKFEDTLSSLDLAAADQKQSELRLEERLPVLVTSDARSAFMRTVELEHPFSYTLHVHKEVGVRAVPVDLVETFNLVMGIAVERLRYSSNDGRDYWLSSGMYRGTNVLVVWRDVEGLDPTAELAFLQKEVPRLMGSHLNGFDRVWHNADSAIPNGCSLDAEFHRLMFEPEPGLS